MMPDSPEAADMVHFRRHPATQLTTSGVTLAGLRATISRMVWPQYEVDPSWSGFCQFGPEDIGGVWEQLGVIRKKPQIAAVYASQETLDSIRSAVSPVDEDFPGFGGLDRLCGVPVYLTPVLGDKAMIKTSQT